MQGTLPSAGDELHAALLQAAVTAALAALSAFLYYRHRKAYFAWWAGAWGLYLLRIGAISSFLLTGQWIWLYWHQVVTGWTALALLGAALAFSQQVRWRWWYLPVVLFPPVWSYVAIYRLDNFLLAAGPAVLFLSLATLWTGWVFVRYRRRVASSGATVLAAAFLLWGLHHLDYPFLRARGAWVPWGYYLDILFALAVGTGILFLVLENVDLYRRLQARTVELTRLSTRMVEQHEEERRRLSRELHDETAQLFSAVKMELGLLRETVPPDQSARLGQVLELVDEGIRSIRSVTNDLRPSLLDDLGLLPALRSLATDFSERSGIRTSLAAPPDLPPLSKEAELALFRALQEALANVARHADARAVDVGISVRDGRLSLRVRDDGRGPPLGGRGRPPHQEHEPDGEYHQEHEPDGEYQQHQEQRQPYQYHEHMGLLGMRERIGALGGSVRLRSEPGEGTLLEVEVPVHGERMA